MRNVTLSKFFLQSQELNKIAAASVTSWKSGILLAIFPEGDLILFYG